MEDLTNKSEGKPPWLLSIARDNIREIDVRPAIRSGTDPLKTILEVFRTMQDGQVLCVINSFTPYPLINLLAKQSLAYTSESEGSEVHTWFLKRNQGEAEVLKPAGAGVRLATDDAFAAAVAGFKEEHIRRIDVRALPAPVPMQTILDELASLPRDHALYVYHKKVPVYLLEQLQDQPLAVHVLGRDNGGVRLLIHSVDL